MIKSGPALWSLLSLYAGFAMLAVSQYRHWRTLTKSAAEPPTGAPLLGFRLVAAVLLLTGLCLCIDAAGISFGIVLWAAQLFAAATVVAFTLSWLPSLLRPGTRLLASIASRLRGLKSE